MSFKEKINTANLPKHIAIIMDGNGRWAKKQGLFRTLGHEKGSLSVKEVVTGAREIGIENLTLYAFSTENWNRPKTEIQMLMKLLVSSLKKEVKTMQENDIKLNAIGCLENLPQKAQTELKEVLEKTKSNSAMNLTLALSYGAREELTNCFRKIGKKIKTGLLQVEDIEEKTINEHLYTKNLPDVDFLIRTSGEQRISNFLLWQIAYAELYFTDILWPDFTKENLYQAIYEYQNRERRFGKTSEQLS